MQVAVPGNVKKMDPLAIRRHFMDTTRQRIEYAGDRVCEWDVINHPVALTSRSLPMRSSPPITPATC